MPSCRLCNKMIELDHLDYWIISFLEGRRLAREAFHIFVCSRCIDDQLTALRSRKSKKKEKKKNEM